MEAGSVKRGHLPPLCSNNYTSQSFKHWLCSECISHHTSRSTHAGTIIAKSISTNQNSFGAKTHSCCIAGIMAPSWINIQFVCNFAKTMSDSFSVPLRSKTALWKEFLYIVHSQDRSWDTRYLPTPTTVRPNYWCFQRYNHDWLLISIF